MTRLHATELLGLPFSPWSEKAKWALEVRKVPYRFRHYEPLLGELELRRKTKRWRGNVTVPVLTADDGVVYADSLDIARFADERGEGPTLFPKEHEAAMTRWLGVAERGLDAGRALSLSRSLQSREALLELVPKHLRGLPFASSLAAFGVRRTLRKYGGTSRSKAEHEKALTAVLDELRAALATSATTPKTLLGAFTFADIAVAQVFAFVSPPAFGLKLGKANRESFTDTALATKHADLIAWRDALYEAHRPK